MYVNSPGEKILNCAISAATVMILFVLISIRFDFFYDMNDDLLIRDILSGRYTGTPEVHTNQLLIPLSAALSLIYRLLPRVPVYGIFLCICIMLCLFLISSRVLTFFKSIKSKIVAVATLAIWTLGMFAWEIVFIQYTVVAGLLAGTSVFLIASLDYYSVPDAVSGMNRRSYYGADDFTRISAVRSEVKEFWGKIAPAFICFMLSFLLRQEMALIAFPFIILACIFRWMDAYERQRNEKTGFEKGNILSGILCRDNLVKYPVFILVLFVFMFVAAFVDRLSYGSREWQDFRSFFDARTSVYDYTWYPEYEKARDFYKENGISEEQYELINHYNFGLDETIDDKVLEKIAEYNEKDRHLGGAKGRIKNVVYGMIKTPLEANHITFGAFLAAIYILYFGLAVVQGEKKKYGKRIILTAITGMICRSYLFWVDRAVDRVLHPLYMIEFLLIAALLVIRLYDRPLWNRERYYRRIVAVTLIALSLFMIPDRMSAIAGESAFREEILEKQQELEEYTKKANDEYYYIDVYSTVKFTDKIFGNHNNEKRNYDYAGGWIYHSPLQEKVGLEIVSGSKEGKFLLEEALLTDRIYFIAERSCDVSFIKDYYHTKGIQVEIQVVDTLTKGEDPLVVYNIWDNSRETN